MSWLAFALIAPALYATTNFIEKYLLETRLKDPIIITIFEAIPATILGITSLIILGFPSLPPVQLGLIILSGILLEFYLVPFFMALNEEDTSRVVPLFQFIPAFVLIISFLFLKETITARQLIGFLLIFSGGFTLGIEKFEKGIIKLRKALYLMLLSSFLYSFTIILFKFVVVKISFWTTIGYEFVGIGIGAAILLLIPNYRRKFLHDGKKADLKTLSLLALGSILVVIAQLSLSVAYKSVSVALASVVSGSAQPLIIIFAGLFLTIFFPKVVKEDVKGSTILLKLAAIVSIILGIILVQL